MIDSLHHIQISIPIGAEDTAREFYCGTLGMHEIPKPGSLMGRGGFWAELDGLQVHFGTEDGVERSRSKAHAAYLVADLEECRRRLNEKGIDAIDGIEIPGFSRFEFRDPFETASSFCSGSIASLRNTRALSVCWVKTRYVEYFPRF